MDNLVSNLEYLMRRKGLKSQNAVATATSVSQRHIGYILNRDKMPGLGVLARLANGFGVELWQLLAPPELLQQGMNRECAKLLKAFLAADDSGQQTILRVADAQAVYDVDRLSAPDVLPSE